MPGTFKTIHFSFGSRPGDKDVLYIEVMYGENSIFIHKDAEEESMNMYTPQNLEEGIVTLQFRKDYAPLELLYDGNNFGVIALDEESNLKAVTRIREEEITVQVYPFGADDPMSDYGHIILKAKMKDGEAIGLVIVGTGGLPQS